MAHYFLLKEQPTDEEIVLGIGFVAIPRMIPPYRFEPKVVVKNQQRTIRLDQREFTSTPVFVPEAGVSIKYTQKSKLEFKFPFPKPKSEIVIELVNNSDKPMVVNGRKVHGNQWLEITPGQPVDLNGRQVIILGHENLLENFWANVLGISHADYVQRGLFFDILLNSFSTVVFKEGLCQSTQGVHHQYQVEYITAVSSAEAGLLIHLIKSTLYQTVNYLLASGHPQAGFVLGIINGRRQDMPFGMRGNPIQELATEAAHHTREARRILKEGKDIDELRAMPKKIDFKEVVRILKNSLALAKNFKPRRKRGPASF